VKVISTTKAPAAIGPYSQAIEANGTLYVSGQLPLCPEKMVFLTDDAAGQTKQSLANIAAILAEAGYTPDQVVRCGIFIKNMDDFPAINEAYGQFFGDHKPARATVEVARLPKDALVEIDAIAVK